LTIYNDSNSPLYSYCMVIVIAVDLQGNKWFANGKVFKYDGVNWVTYDDNNSPVTGWISRIRVDRFGNKWFASGSGVLKLDMAGNWSVYDTTNYGLGHPYLSVYSIGVDLLGDKWFGTYEKGVLKYSNNQLVSYTTANSSLASNQVYRMAIDDQNNKWFISQYSKKVSKFDGVNWNVYTVPTSGNGLRAIAIDRSNIKWVGIDTGGVSKFDGSNWTNYNIYNSGLAGKGVSCIAIDSFNTKWFGTYSWGLSKFDGTNWTTFNTSNSGLPNNNVSVLVVDSTDNNLWIGTLGGWLCFFDGTNSTVYDTSNSGIASNNIWGVGIDKNGNKWFTTYFSGVSKFDGTNWTTYDVANSGIAGHQVLGVTIDNENNKWFCTNSVSVLADNDSIRIFSPYSYISPNPLEAFFKIYPNPSKGEINFETIDNIITDVSIFNLTGELVSSFSQPQITLLDLSQFESGVYLIKAKFGEKTATKRWVKL